ncbi:hypothetical protein SARC_00939 [Sphaeroforma arctica JP610]|uniref:Uncharacterized protein n=1 Tax=Sphaeroforma arctica JP610 TaxID=667725 RepID=A0A0L0GD43_9EUKA|nr:hypothetical protein SARC_00939 [Sphaeroforma arctica JP610]KNC86937.1 hypothetical protein SARC_00939 [Sphaeroforma arctica JP610]|eukprot:XP_014160839.1 hypothetical protein SARC_00939 [Sphaeroforma arctica JP610]
MAHSTLSVNATRAAIGRNRSFSNPTPFSITLLGSTLETMLEHESLQTDSNGAGDPCQDINTQAVANENQQAEDKPTATETTGDHRQPPTHARTTSSSPVQELEGDVDAAPVNTDSLCSQRTEANVRSGSTSSSVLGGINRRRNSLGTFNFKKSKLKVVMNYKFTLDVHTPIVYDHGLVTGFLKIVALENGIIEKLSVLLVCTLTVKRIDTPNIQRVCPVYQKEVVLGQQVECRKGETDHPFSFVVPPGMPSSFRNGSCAVTWEVRSTDRSCAMQPVVTRCLFNKTSIYRTLPGFIPTAQAERKMFMNPSKRIKVEAELSADVYTAGTPIEVCVKILNDYKLLYLKRVKAKVVQSCEAWMEGRRLFAREVDLDWSKHEVKNWEKLRVGEFKPLESEADQQVADEKSAVSKTFALLPRIDKRHKCAVQKMSIGRDSEGQPMSQPCLPPTTDYASRDTGLWVFIKYYVSIKCDVQGADSIEFKLNVTLQSQIQDTDNFSADIENCLVFSPMDDPPEYDALQTKSKTSYTSLRRNSMDSVFARTQSALESPFQPYTNILSDGTLGVPTASQALSLDRTQTLPQEHTENNFRPSTGSAFDINAHLALAAHCESSTNTRVPRRASVGGETRSTSLRASKTPF